MKQYDYLIVGSGFAGAVAAERLASQKNKKILIVEKRNHIGGNAFDEYDEYGILVHRYGPHLFHTNSKEVFDYLSKFTEWRFYEHKVLAKLENELFPIPINRLTLNKLFNLGLKTDSECQKYLEQIREKRYPILNSEDIIVNQVGYNLLEKFFKYYTIKQWGMEPKDLSPSVCGRIPVRYNEDCRYFTDKYQCIPKLGYTKMFENMLNHKNIEVILNTDYKKIINEIKFDKMIYTGPIDYFFDYCYGALPYRSIRFEWENFKKESFQETSQVNFVEENPKYTRIIEHKKITGQISNSTTLSYEFPQNMGDPFYPIPNNVNNYIYNRYEQLASKLKNVKFLGRLAEYKYYNMDQVVAATLKFSNK